MFVITYIQYNLTLIKKHIQIVILFLYMMYFNKSTKMKFRNTYLLAHIMHFSIQQEIDTIIWLKYYHRVRT